MGSKKCVIKTRCDYHSCHRLTLCGTINHQQFHCSHSTLHGRDSRWYTSKILVGKEVKELRKKGALIKRSFSVCVCVWSMIGRIPQKIWKHCEWLTSLLITEQPIMLGFGSFGTSSEDIQRSWKLEIQSMSEKKKKIRFKNRLDLSCLCNGSPRDVYFSYEQQTQWREVETKELTSVISSLTAWFDLTLFHLVLFFFCFLGNDAWINVASAKPHMKGKHTLFLGKNPCLVNQGVCCSKEEPYMCPAVRSGWGLVIFWGLLLSYWGFTYCGCTFSLFTFPCQGFGWRFRCLRINYFNLTLIVTCMHPAATHLPLQPTFKEQSRYVCVSSNRELFN